LKRKAGNRLKVLILIFLGGSGLIAVFAFGNYTGVKLTQTGYEKGCFSLPEDVVDLDFPQVKDYVRFVAIGDTGDGSEAQKRVAESIRQVCQGGNCDFALMLGDNFYEGGLQSLQDPLFKLFFEDIYQDIGIPFIAVLGNHDLKGNVFAQIYHSLDSPFWRMPNFSYNFQAGPASFFGFNTSCGILQAEGVRQDVEESQSPWKFLFGHQPVYSGGVHGDLDPLSRGLWNNYFQGKVDFYLSGHDHQLEHLQVEGEKTEYIVSGSGGKNYRSSSDKNKVKSSAAKSRFRYQDNGFVWFQVSPDRVISRFYDASGTQLYEFQKTKD